MCKYQGCRVRAEPGETLCILHLPVPKDVNRFKEVLYRQIDEEGPEETRNLRFWFREYVFPAGIATSSDALNRHAASDVLLPATIEGDANFHGATIEGGAIFPGAIEGDANFLGAKIGGGAIFSGTIGGRTSFDGAEIGGNVEFFDAEIGGDASFNRAKIGGNASFSWVEIGGNVEFSDAEIGGIADFWKVEIGCSAYFDGATIGGSAHFVATKIRGDAFFDAAKLESLVNFRFCSAGSLFLGQRKPQIRGWRLDVGRCGLDLPSNFEASSFWRFAQHCFSKNGERESADAAFYFERVWRWKELRRTEIPEGKALRGLRSFLLRAGYTLLWSLDCLLLRWTTAYGASIARLFVTWIAVIAGFGVVFSALPRVIERGGVEVLSLRNWIIGFHYSVTTFATLGLGRIGPGPSRLGMVLTSIEALIGAILIALAVLVLGRRFMRQG